MELADRQDHEVGDGTTSVVILASELLKVSARVEQLVLLRLVAGSTVFLD